MAFDSSQYQRERRLRRIREGLCIGCASKARVKRNGQIGVRCKPCADKIRHSVSAIYKAIRAAGACLDCGCKVRQKNPVTLEPRVRCQSCAERHLETRKQNAAVSDRGA